ncbi:ATP-binding protein [Streptomyces umbrinus]|uniref:ATP-binding protein n=1 Tax=Streptomyces umbrinus TaxID=67370 RepID=UPI0033C5F644
MNSDSGIIALPSERTALPARTFTQQFSSTRRGARLARLLAVNQFDAWGWPHSTEISQTAALLVAELASNAMFHARVQGRDFRLRLTMDDALDRARASAVLRIEVTDPRGECLPQVLEPALPTIDCAPAPAPAPVTDAEGGRGLLLVQALATRWGVRPYPPSGKTVWCELDLCPCPGSPRGHERH